MKETEFNREELIKKIQQVGRKFPGIRLAQMILNIRRPHETDIYHLTDSELIERLEMQYGPFND
jgi:hypothetical protein